MNSNIDSILMTPNHIIKDAMSSLSSSGLRIVLIVDEQKRLKGTVTDGDIRRSLLNGFSIDSVLRDVMNKTPICVLPHVPHIAINDLMSKNGILAVPVVDEKDRLLGLEDLSISSKTIMNPTPVLIMAGGFGKRLGILTKELPKPMIKVGNKPIIENIIDKLIEQGFYKFFISVHFKPEKLKEHFKDGSEKGVEIQYIEESEPLGTGGALALIKDRINDNLVVVNGDLLIDFDANLLTQYHESHNADVTVCVRKENFIIPFGVVDIGEKKVIQILEKPTYFYTVNAGIYCFSSSALKGIKKIKPIDMTDIINRTAKTKTVLPFLIYEEWIDIGCPSALDKAKKVIV